jgi:hypothetical protein
MLVVFNLFSSYRKLNWSASDLGIDMLAEEMRPTERQELYTNSHTISVLSTY